MEEKEAQAKFENPNKWYRLALRIGSDLALVGLALMFISWPAQLVVNWSEYLKEVGGYMFGVGIAPWVIYFVQLASLQARADEPRGGLRTVTLRDAAHHLETCQYRWLTLVVGACLIAISVFIGAVFG